jgi:transcriptional regulator with XRE-family HTH domain
MAHPLKTFRETHNLSQSELARLLETSRSNINRWESGERNIESKMIPTIAEKTGIPAAELRPDLAELLGVSQ